MTGQHRPHDYVDSGSSLGCGVLQGVDIPLCGPKTISVLLGFDVDDMTLTHSLDEISPTVDCALERSSIRALVWVILDPDTKARTSVRLHLVAYVVGRSIETVSCAPPTVLDGDYEVAESEGSRNLSDVWTKSALTNGPPFALPCGSFSDFVHPEDERQGRSRCSYSYRYLTRCGLHCGGIVRWRFAPVKWSFVTKLLSFPDDDSPAPPLHARIDFEVDLCGVDGGGIMVDVSFEVHLSST